MNKKLNKNGFTLVELLAVIVVLALILVLAVPSVLNTMNSAKQKSFQMYGQKVITLAMQKYETDRLLNPTDTNKCYNISSELGLNGSGTYHGWVVVSRATGNNEATYTLYMDDGSDFSYTEASGKDILGGTKSPDGTYKLQTAPSGCSGS